MKVTGSFKNLLSIELHAKNAKSAAKKFGILLKGGGYVNKFGTTDGTEITITANEEIYKFLLWYESWNVAS